MKLVFCNHCWFVYIDPAGSPGHDGRPVKLEACPQCFGNGGGKLLPVPAAVVLDAEVLQMLVRRTVKEELLRRQYTVPRPATFPIATTPPVQGEPIPIVNPVASVLADGNNPPKPKPEDECRPQ